MANFTERAFALHQSFYTYCSTGLFQTLQAIASKRMLSMACGVTKKLAFSTVKIED